MFIYCVFLAVSVALGITEEWDDAHAHPCLQSRLSLTEDIMLPGTTNGVHSGPLSRLKHVCYTSAYVYVDLNT